MKAHCSSTSPSYPRPPSRGQPSTITRYCHMLPSPAGLRAASLLLPLALVLLTGCPPRHPAVAPTAPAPLPIGQAVAAVNNNVAGITETLSGGGIDVHAVFHEDNAARTSSFLGTLRFLPPRNLYLELSLIAEPGAMVIGSNENLFWVAIKLNRNELWYGSWADLDPAETYRMPLPPDMILAATGLAPLPGPRDNLLGPVPQTDDGRYYKLLYLASSGGAIWIQREYWLDRFPPYLPRVVMFRMPDGTVRMQSTLDRYERVGRSEVYVARQIRMVWPREDNRLALDIGALSFNPRIKAGSRAFEIRTTIPRDRWVRVSNETRPTDTAPTQPAISEPAATRPANAPPQELESSPE
jgi:hypothetical protein